MTTATSSEFKTITINMGPQHPSTHGVLRLVIELDGETVVSLKPVMGYLHTGMEKIMESKTYTKSITVTDRMDYLSPLGNNMAYVGAVERIMGLEIPERAQVLRVILLELTRISSHLVWLGTHAFVPFVKKFCDEFPVALGEYQSLLSKNRIWMKRTIGVGTITAEHALQLSVTGPTLRGSGIAYDVRKTQPYCGYETYEFETPLGRNGDVYERYLCRIEEMKQSLKLVRQGLDRLRPGTVRADNPYLFPANREDVKKGMEELIFHFKIMSEGFRAPTGDAYFAIESPKGELGFYVASDGGPLPYRVRVRPPSFINLQALEGMCIGRMVSDVVACIGSIDIV